MHMCMFMSLFQGDPKKLDMHQNSALSFFGPFVSSPVVEAVFVALALSCEGGIDMTPLDAPRTRSGSRSSEGGRPSQIEYVYFRFFRFDVVCASGPHGSCMRFFHTDIRM